MVLYLVSVFFVLCCVLRYSFKRTNTSGDFDVYSLRDKMSRKDDLFVIPIMSTRVVEGRKDCKCFRDENARHERTAVGGGGRRACLPCGPGSALQLQWEGDRKKRGERNNKWDQGHGNKNRHLGKGHVTIYYLCPGRRTTSRTAPTKWSASSSPGGW